MTTMPIANLDAALQANGAQHAVSAAAAASTPVPGSQRTNGSQHPISSQYPPLNHGLLPSTHDPSLNIAISDPLRFPGWEDITTRPKPKEKEQMEEWPPSKAPAGSSPVKLTFVAVRRGKARDEARKDCGRDKKHTKATEEKETTHEQARVLSKAALKSKPKTKSRAVLLSETESELEDEEGFGAHVRPEKRKKGTNQDEEVAGVAEGKNKKKKISYTAPGKRGKSVKGALSEDDNIGANQALPGNAIVIMTTQVRLADDVIKALGKLGVKTTIHAKDCTHLLAPRVVRTEKFLCAVASRAPWVLQDKWAIESAKAKKILPEKDFILRDKTGENKYGVNLVQALKRAKELIKDCGLLAGHRFYLTPRVPVDPKILKNIIVASGGQVLAQTPTIRIIDASPLTRHVISCPEDIAIWRPLVSSRVVKIYKLELILNGVLRQEMEWDREDYLVQGSY